MALAEIQFEKHHVEFIYSDTVLHSIFEVKCLRGGCLRWYGNLYKDGRPIGSLGYADHPESFLKEAQRMIAEYRNGIGGA